MVAKERARGCRPRAEAQETEIEHSVDNLSRLNWQSVNDGQTCVGHLIRRGKLGIEAFDADNRSLGIFRWRCEQFDAALAGPHDEALGELTAFLETMTLKSAAALIEHARAGPWQNADSDVRFLALHMINEAIVQLREQHGLPPFDDNLPGQPENAFRRVKRILFSEPALAAGAAPEPMPVSEN